MSRVREMAEGKVSLHPEYYRQTAGLGWFEMLVQESDGGVYVPEEGIRNAVVVAVERGRTLQPGLYVPMNSALVGLSRDGTSSQKSAILPSALRGETVLTWAWAELLGLAARRSPLTIRTYQDGFILCGDVECVQDFGDASWLLVSTQFEGGTQFLLPTDTSGLTCHAMSSLDLTRTFCRLRFDDVFVEESMLVGDVGRAGATMARQFDIALLLTCAEATGAMGRDFEMALAYSRERLAFGRPIGSFQAIKHSLANASLMFEEAQAITWTCAEAMDGGSSAASHLASIAKAFVGDSGMEIAQTCLQVFGGIGYTWDHDQHLYLRRLAMDAELYGDARWHRERLVQINEGT